MQSPALLLLIRITLLAFSAGVLAGILQRRSADLAHRVWVTALAGIALLPLLGLIMPTWAIDTGFAEKESPAVPQSTEPDRASTPSVDSVPPRTVQVDSLPPTIAVPERSATDKPAVAAAPAAKPAVSIAPAPWSLDWPRTCWALWGIIAAYFLTRLIFAIAMLTRQARRASNPSAELEAVVTDITLALGVHQRCHIRTLPIGAMPRACWIGRWLVLLPEDIMQWPENLRWTVIAHELGHLVRRDAWSDLLAQVVCRVLWFHPVLWLAYSAIPRLRERACDEWLLATGRISARDYAHHLLDVVSRCPKSNTTLGTAMAGAADIERRVQALFAASSRKRVGSVVKLLTVAGCLSLTALLAAGQPAPREITPLQTPPQSPAPTRDGVQLATEPVRADGPKISVSGVIVTPEGKPISGAVVVLRAKTLYSYAIGVLDAREMLARMKTDADGRFDFDRIGIPLRQEGLINSLSRGEGGAEVIAWADGRAIAHCDIKKLTGNNPVRLTLQDESKVEGFVRDSSGRPVANIPVIVWSMSPVKAGLTSITLGTSDLQVGYSESYPQNLRTDGQGKFTLPHLPTNHRILIGFQGAGFARKMVYVDTSEDRSVTEVPSDRGEKLTIAVQHSPLDVALTPQQSVTVKVIDHTGKPVLEGAVLKVDAERHGVIADLIDAQGEAHISIEKPGRYNFSYATDPLTPRIGAALYADIKADDKSLALEIRLPEATWLSGHVVDADTGRGVVGAHVSYSQKSSTTDFDQNYSGVVSGAEGAFRIPVVRGPGQLRFSFPVYGYLPAIYQNLPNPDKGVPSTAIDVPATGSPEPVTLPLGRGLVLRGVVIDAAKKPVAGAAVLAQNDGRPNRRSNTTTNAEGKFELPGLSPYTKVLLTVAAPEGGAREVIEPVAAEYRSDKTLTKDIAVQLKQGVSLSGRALYKGQPRAGVVMKLFHSYGKEVNSYFLSGSMATDANGNYRLYGLEKGDNYYFEITDPDGMNDPNWQYQSPYIMRIAAGKSEITLPDINLMTLGQTLRGVIVDPQGKGVPGAHVVAHLADPKNGNIPRPATGPPPWTETDAQGRFELLQLPDAAVELMAYKDDPNDNRISPATIRPARDDQNIRILLDPALVQDIEDLDAKK